MSTLGRVDRVRLLIVPGSILMLFYVLFLKRCLLDGWSGWYYTFQRVCAETMLSIELLAACALWLNPDRRKPT